jgi:hypothetical protein
MWREETAASVDPEASMLEIETTGVHGSAGRLHPAT